MQTFKKSLGDGESQDGMQDMTKESNYVTKL